MKIVSFIEESFLEYEDHISLVLFSYGCNIKCGYCYNYHHVTNPDMVMAEDVYSIIDNHVTFLTDGLVLLGGEPTIYGTELFEISSYAKRKHNLSVKLFSNGTRPDIITCGMLNGSFNHVSVDFKSYHPTEHVMINSDWSSYVSGLLSLLTFVDRNGLNDRIEVRMTVALGMEESFGFVKRICDRLGIKFHKQTDVRESYKQLGVAVG